MTIREHGRLLAGFFFIKGALMSLFWVISGGFLGGAWLALIFSAFFMVTGWKIEKEKGDAKIFGIIASILSLGSFPLGTALGIYGLWFFLMRSNEEF